jgi:hypothetical protein
LGRWLVPGSAWVAGISCSLYLSYKIALHLVQTAFGELPNGRAIFPVHALVIVPRCMT